MRLLLTLATRNSATCEATLLPPSSKSRSLQVAETWKSPKPQYLFVRYARVHKKRGGSRTPVGSRLSCTNAILKRNAGSRLQDREASAPRARAASTPALGGAGRAAALACAAAARPTSACAPSRAFPRAAASAGAAPRTTSPSACSRATTASSRRAATNGLPRRAPAGSVAAPSTGSASAASTRSSASLPTATAAAGLRCTRSAAGRRHVFQAFAVTFEQATLKIHQPLLPFIRRQTCSNSRHFSFSFRC
jgi:hypothetical protein